MLPKIIDLFSGCGGLALGFEKAGFDIAAGIELMPEAHQTVSYNIDFRHGREATHICGDITETDAGVFGNCFGDEGCVVIGGPPCQAYSIAGRAKLRSLGEDRINTNDTRGYLYQDFLRFVYDLDAQAVVMENVPEAVNFGDMNIPEIVCEFLEKHGYTAIWTVLNSADYGVPQIRERIFLIGVKKNLNVTVEFPAATHTSKDDYQTKYTRRFSSFSDYPHFAVPETADTERKPWVSVDDAISDLPVLFSDSNSKYKNMKLSEELDYKCEASNEYQQLMRTWYDSEPFGITANSFRNTRRDFPIFERMKQGDDYIAASKIADELFEREASILGYIPGSEEYLKLKKKMVPVYDREKFERKWQKLRSDLPSHTLVAHLSKDTYSHIHPIEPRGISVREAARIQSFPDDFFFSCSMGDAFKQIGNAVPPLLAYRVAECLHKAFSED